MSDADSQKRDGGGGARGQASRGGLVARFVEVLGAGSDPARQRRRVLREYARRVQRSRPRLYNHRSGSADVAMGAMFHGFYRVLGPARILLRNAAVSTVLKSVTVERVLSARQRELLVSLGEEALTALAEGKDTSEFVQIVRERLKELAAGFDRRTVERAQRAYRAVMVLVDLVNYDYWTVLRRFDSRYPEADFTYTPRFLPLDGEYVGDPLKDFLEVLAPVVPELDWSQALDTLREFRGMEVVGAEGWRGLLRSIGEMKKSGMLLAIVRLIDGEVTYVPRTRAAAEKLIEPYLGAVRRQTEAVVRRVTEAKRQQGVQKLAREVFGERELPRLANYTTAADERFARKSLPGFANAVALAYVKAYLIELHKTSVKETVDAALIRGKWRETGLSRSLSDAYQEILAVLNDLLEFDRRLGDNQEIGVKLKAALTRADRSKGQTLAPARQLIAQLDATAKGFITRTAQGCAVMGQILKALVEDAGRPSAQILANWQELRGSSREEDLRERLVGTFRKLRGLVELVRLSAGHATTGASPAAAEHQEVPAREPPPEPEA